MCTCFTSMEENKTFFFFGGRGEPTWRIKILQHLFGYQTQWLWIVCRTSHLLPPTDCGEFLVGNVSIPLNVALILCVCVHACWTWGLMIASQALHHWAVFVALSLTPALTLLNQSLTWKKLRTIYLEIFKKDDMEISMDTNTISEWILSSQDEAQITHFFHDMRHNG